MQAAFNNRYKFFDKASINMVESILDTGNFVEVSGKNLALEITKQNQCLT